MKSGLLSEHAKFSCGDCYSKREYVVKQVPVVQKRATVARAEKSCDYSQDHTRQQHCTVDAGEDHAAARNCHR